MTGEVVFALTYVAGALGCGFYLWLGLKGMRADYGNEYFASYLLPGLAGFGLFPLVNFVIALSLTAWVLTKRWRQ